MSQYEEEEAENQPQTEEIEEAEANEDQNEKEAEENEKVLNNAIVESLINRTKKLEEENNQLKEDIQKINTYDKGGALWIPRKLSFRYAFPVDRFCRAAETGIIRQTRCSLTRVCKLIIK